MVVVSVLACVAATAAEAAEIRPVSLAWFEPARVVEPGRLSNGRPRSEVVLHVKAAGVDSALLELPPGMVEGDLQWSIKVGTGGEITLSILGLEGDIRQLERALESGTLHPFFQDRLTDWDGALEIPLEFHPNCERGSKP
jgi:hypothetical protein